MFALTRLRHVLKEFASADEADIASDIDAGIQLQPLQQPAGGSALRVGSADGVRPHQAGTATTAGFLDGSVLADPRAADTLFQPTPASNAAEGALGAARISSTVLRQHGALGTQPVHVQAMQSDGLAPSALFGHLARAANSGIGSTQEAARGEQAEDAHVADHEGAETAGAAAQGGIMQRLAAAPAAVRAALFGRAVAGDGGAQFSRTGGGGGDGARGSGFAAVMSVESSGAFNLPASMARDREDVTSG